MTNNLLELKKNLKSFAKRCKDFKYTDSALIAFLLCGNLLSVNLFSASIDKSIESQKQEISSSIKAINQKVKETRRQNNKLLRNTNLELVQLMEQGDYVIKSPWSSWQYGMNYFNNNWNGTYKGRGDKKAKYPYEGVYTRSLNAFERSVSPESLNYGRLLAPSTNINSALTNARGGLELGYGIASTLPVPEPIVSLELSAGIRPRKVDKQPLNIQLDPVNAPAAPTLNVSANTPVAVTPPTVTPPTVTLDLPTPNTKPFNDFSFIEGRFGDYEQPVDKIEAAATSYTLGVNPNNPDINPNNVNNANKANYLNNKAYQVTNGTISPTGGKTAAAIWRINDKRGTLRNQDTESNWNSDMTEDVNNPIVHGFNYGGNSATDRVKFYVAGDILDNGSNKLGTQNRKVE